MQRGSVPREADASAKVVNLIDRQLADDCITLLYSNRRLANAACRHGALALETLCEAGAVELVCTLLYSRTPRRPAAVDEMAFEILAVLSMHAVAIPTLRTPTTATGMSPLSHLLEVLDGVFGSDDPVILVWCLEIFYHVLDPVLLLADARGAAHRAGIARRATDDEWLSGALDAHPGSRRDRQETFALVRSENAIRALLRRLRFTDVPMMADEVRALACRSLARLVEDDTIRQLLQELQVANDLDELIREPVADENVEFHKQFQKYAMQVIMRVAGREAVAHTQDATETARRRIEKTAIVNATKIQYSQRELLLLIHDHLLEQGLATTAAELDREAHLDIGSRQAAAPACSSPAPGGMPPLPRRTEAFSSYTSRKDKADVGEQRVARRPASTGTVTPPAARPAKRIRVERSVSLDAAAGLESPWASPQVRRVREAFGPVEERTLAGATPDGTAAGRATSSTRSTSGADVARASGSTPARAPPAQHATSSTSASRGNTLDNIVSQYLRQQHLQCYDPIAVLPTMSLLQPHVCPTPRWARSRPPGLHECLAEFEVRGARASRWAQQLRGSYCFSRMAEVYHVVDEEHSLLCAALPSQWPGILLTGASGGGGVSAFNYLLQQDLGIIVSCDEDIMDIIPAYRSAMIAIVDDEALTIRRLRAMPPSAGEASMESVDGPISSSALLRVPEAYGCSFSQDEERCVIGRRSNCAEVFDIVTGASVRSFASRHRNPLGAALDHPPSFSPDGNLVVYDAALYDTRIRGSAPIHAFEMLSGVHVNGLFHPSGLAVLLGSMVWDLRRFRLQRRCEALDGCALRISATGTAVFGVHLANDATRAPEAGQQIRTVDLSTYDMIATVETHPRRLVERLALDGRDDVVCTIETPVPAQDRELFEDDPRCYVYELGKGDAEHGDNGADDDDAGGGDGDEDGGDGGSGLRTGSDSDASSSGFGYELDDSDDDALAQQLLDGEFELADPDDSFDEYASGDEDGLSDWGDGDD